MPSRGTLLNAVGALAVVAILATMLVVVFPPVVGAEHSYVVVSGSMEPTLSPGDVVLVEDAPPSAVESGDVVTFERDGVRTTHRVVDVVGREGTPHFRTQGDANDAVDQRLVGPEELVGRVAFTIPLVGHFLSFARTDVGILLLVVLPAGLLVLSELWTLGRALAASRSDDSTLASEGDQ